MPEQIDDYPIHKPKKTDLYKILRLIENGDLRDIDDKIISCRCGNCGKFAINNDEENKENEENNV